MPWVRFDDQYPIHRKVNRLSDAAFRFHTEAIFWCGRNLTDGYLSDEDLSLVSNRVRHPERLAADFVSRGLWHLMPTECDSVACLASVDNQLSTGWVIHDYLQYQPSKAQVKRTRERNAQDQKAWRDRRKDTSKTLTQALSQGTPDPTRPVNGSVVTEPARGRHIRVPNDHLNGTSTPAARHPSARTVAEAIADATPSEP